MLDTNVLRSFEERQKYYDETYKQRSYSWRKGFDFIMGALHMLRFSKCKTIVELGCADGGLAVACLQNLHSDYSWIGYDFSKIWIPLSRWHPRYTPILLEKQIWEMDLPPFDVFVSSHCIEHLYADEVQELALWLGSRTRFLILVIPLGLHSSPTRADHILGKGSLWVKDVLAAAGFDVVWETGRYWGWFKKREEKRR